MGEAGANWEKSIDMFAISHVKMLEDVTNILRLGESDLVRRPIALALNTQIVFKFSILCHLKARDELLDGSKKIKIIETQVWLST